MLNSEALTIETEPAFTLLASGYTEVNCVLGCCGGIIHGEGVLVVVGVWVQIYIYITKQQRPFLLRYKKIMYREGALFWVLGIFRKISLCK